MNSNILSRQEYEALMAEDAMVAQNPNAFAMANMQIQQPDIRMQILGTTGVDIAILQNMLASVNIDPNSIYQCLNMGYNIFDIQKWVYQAHNSMVARNVQQQYIPNYNQPQVPSYGYYQNPQQQVNYGYNIEAIKVKLSNNGIYNKPEPYDPVAKTGGYDFIEVSKRMTEQDPSFDLVQYAYVTSGIRVDRLMRDLEWLGRNRNEVLMLAEYGFDIYSIRDYVWNIQYRALINRYNGAETTAELNNMIKRKCELSVDVNTILQYAGASLNDPNLKDKVITNFVRQGEDGWKDRLEIAQNSGLLGVPASYTYEPLVAFIWDCLNKGYNNYDIYLDYWNHPEIFGQIDMNDPKNILKGYAGSVQQNAGRIFPGIQQQVRQQMYQQSYMSPFRTLNSKIKMLVSKARCIATYKGEKFDEQKFINDLYEANNPNSKFAKLSPKEQQEWMDWNNISGIMRNFNDPRFMASSYNMRVANNTLRYSAGFHQQYDDHSLAEFLSDDLWRLERDDYILELRQNRMNDYNNLHKTYSSSEYNYLLKQHKFMSDRKKFEDEVLFNQTAPSEVVPIGNIFDQKTGIVRQPYTADMDDKAKWALQQFDANAMKDTLSRIDTSSGCILFGDFKTPNDIIHLIKAGWHAVFRENEGYYLASPEYIAALNPATDPNYSLPDDNYILYNLDKCIEESIRTEFTVPINNKADPILANTIHLDTVYEFEDDGVNIINGSLLFCGDKEIEDSVLLDYINSGYKIIVVNYDMIWFVKTEYIPKLMQDIHEQEAWDQLNDPANAVGIPMTSIDPDFGNSPSAIYDPNTGAEGLEIKGPTEYISINEDGESSFNIDINDMARRQAFLDSIDNRKARFD